MLNRNYNQPSQKQQQWRLPGTRPLASSNPESQRLPGLERLGNRRAAPNTLSPFKGPRERTTTKGTDLRSHGLVYSQDGATLKYNSPFLFVDREVREKRRHWEMMDAMDRVEGLLRDIKKPRICTDATVTILSNLKSLRDDTVSLRRRFDALDDASLIARSLPVHDMEQSISHVQQMTNRLDLTVKRIQQPIMLRLRLR